MLKVLKVMAYITHGSKLLVFTQPESPEAGLQVPGGTVEVGEGVEAAALREAIEESGLANLRLSNFLGDMRFDVPNNGLSQTYHRYYYHVWCDEEPPESWRHYEYTASDRPAGHEPIPFDIFWVNLKDGIPPLVGNQAAYIPQLITLLGL